MIPEYKTPQRTPSPSRLLPLCLLVPVILCIVAWMWISISPWQFGHITPRNSWCFRCVYGRIDFVRMNYAWPRVQPGWHNQALPPGLGFDAYTGIDANLLADSPSILGVHYKTNPATTFLSVPMYLLTLLFLALFIAAWRRAWPQGKPIAPLWRYAKPLPLPLLRLIILLVILSCLVALLLPSLV